MTIPETQQLVVATCHGRGAPVTGCHCPYCLMVRPVPQPEPVKERLSFPNGDLDDDQIRRTA